ncbi:MAG: acetyl-CoA carboxylase biotin carboxyl carrier protein subunit [Culturomica sp.]|jgi:biotin carboxyl carrier protein|nr:acetyl-CoA carboxylase biotin carboxyl carrier protein subunit [Culturomica sp.]
MSKKYEKLQIDGTDYKTTFTEKWANRKPWVAPNPNMIDAHIPGTITKIFVSEGDEVKEGNVVLRLQAMKMDNEILAPFDAKIKKVNVKEGEKIAKNTVMVELE